MPEIIEIEGNIARIVTKNVVRQVPLSEIMKRIEKVPAITLPTLARSQVFAHQQPGNGSETYLYALCELPPGIRSITKNNKRTSPRGMRRYRLSIPWTYFWFQARTNDSREREQRWAVYDTRVFVSNSQYQGINHPMIVAPFPNLDSMGTVCWGSTSTLANQSLASQLDQKVNEWFLSDFNDDLDSHCHLPYGERNYLRWVTESREDANSWRSWPEFSDPDRRITVTSLLEQHGIELTEAQRFTGGGFIPPVNLPMTFGRWEEWWATIPYEERLRAIRSGQNVQADAPDTFVENEPEDNNTEVDDGGVAV